MFGEYWSRRWLLISFFRRELSNRYAGTIGGGLWAFAQPVLLLAIYSFVFRRVFKVTFPELEDHSFVAFAATALWPWMAFSEGLTRGTHAVLANGSLVRKIRFPHEFLVYASVSAAFAIHLLGYVAVIGVLAVAGETFVWTHLVIVLLGWALLYAFAIGVALLTATLQVFLRDVDHMLGPTLTVLMYLTPILYPLSQVPSGAHPLMQLNPLVHFLEPIRNAMLFAGPLPIGTMLPAAAIAVVALLVGWLAFERLSDYFEEFV